MGPMRVHRALAALAGSWTERLNCYSLAFHIGFATCPLWYLLFSWLFNIYTFSYALLVSFLTTAILQELFLLYAKKSLRAADYLKLGFRLIVPA